MRVRCWCLGCGIGRLGPPDESRRCVGDATQEDGLCDDCRDRGDLDPWLSEVVEVDA